jgi:hypothetical protein
MITGLSRGQRSRAQVLAHVLGDSQEITVDGADGRTRFGLSPGVESTAETRCSMQLC